MFEFFGGLEMCFKKTMNILVEPWESPRFHVVTTLAPRRPKGMEKVDNDRSMLVWKTEFTMTFFRFLSCWKRVRWCQLFFPFLIDISYCTKPGGGRFFECEFAGHLKSWTWNPENVQDFRCVFKPASFSGSSYWVWGCTKLLAKISESDNDRLSNLVWSLPLLEF